MTKNNIIKLAALELQTLNNSDITKVAGVLRRIKNWFRKQTDPVYAQQLQELEINSAHIKEVLSNLKEISDATDQALRDGDILGFDENFDRLKQLTKIFLESVKETNNSVKNISEYYSLTEMGTPEFLETFKKNLPKGFGLELNTVHEKPLSSFKEYSWLDESKLVLSPKSVIILKKDIGNVLKSNQIFKKDDKISIDENELVANFKKAILQGSLRKATPLVPSEEGKPARWGAIDLHVATAPYVLTASSGGKLVKVKFASDVLLADLRNGQTLSIRKIRGTKFEGVLESNLNKLDYSTDEPRTQLEAEKLMYDLQYGPPEEKKLSQEDREALMEELDARKRESSSKLSQILKEALRSQERPFEITKLSETEFARAMAEGYKMVFGKSPSLETLAAGWAQAVLESGRPVSLPCNNVGNIKATKDWIKSGKPYFTTKSTVEFDKKGKKYLHVSPEWRAYDSPAHGAAGYWQLLKGRFGEALDWMGAGDPVSASVVLGKKGYYTANIAKYSTEVGKLYNHFMTKIAKDLPNIKSNAVVLDKEKPEVKELSEDYSRTDMIQPKKDNSWISAIDSLIKKLFASNDGPAFNLVKNAVLKTALPETYFTVYVTSKNSSKYPAARILCEALQDIMQAKYTIYKNADDLEITAKTLGAKFTVAQAAQSVCNIIQTGFNETGNNIDMIVAADTLSSGEELTLDELLTSCRKFNLENLNA